MTRFSPTEWYEYFIMDDWIFYNAFPEKQPGDDGYESYRKRLDQTGKEYLGTDISYILQCADGRVYYNSGLHNHDSDLRSRDLNENEDVLLFAGCNLPLFEHINYMRYQDIRVDGNYVFFTVYVNGFLPVDSWRGHEEYKAHYRVCNDGSGLIKINEDYLCQK